METFAVVKVVDSGISDFRVACKINSVLPPGNDKDDKVNVLPIIIEFETNEGVLLRETFNVLYHDLKSIYNTFTKSPKKGDLRNFDTASLEVFPNEKNLGKTLEISTTFFPFHEKKILPIKLSLLDSTAGKGQIYLDSFLERLEQTISLYK